MPHKKDIASQLLASNILQRTCTQRLLDHIESSDSCFDVFDIPLIDFLKENMLKHVPFLFVFNLENIESKY